MYNRVMVSWSVYYLCTSPRLLLLALLICVKWKLKKKKKSSKKSSMLVLHERVRQ